MRLTFPRFLVSWVAAWAVWLSPVTAYAAYGTVTPPSSIGGSLGNLLMTAGSTHNWAGGKVAALSSINAGGRAVTVPFTVRAASAAGAVVANAIKANPLGLAATLAAGVLLPLVYDDAVNAWEVHSTSSGIDWRYEVQSVDATGAFTGPYAANWIYSSPTAAAEAHLRANTAEFTYSLTGYSTVSCNLPSSPTLNQSVQCSGVVQGRTHNNYTGTDTYRHASISAKAVNVETGSERPATEEDWDQKRVLPICYGSSGTYCWTDEVLNTPEVKAAPLPVETPVLNPNPSGIPQPVRVPTGSPQPIPGTNPQRYRQPFVDVKPWNSPSAPWQVDIIPGVWEGTDPNGLPDPTNDPNAPAPGTGGGTTTELKTCGLPDTPPCKIDESGTKEGDATGEFAGADATRNTAADGIRDMIDNPEAPTTLGWNFTTGLFGFPAASCQPFTWGSRLGALSVDVCNNSLVLTVRSMLAWMLWGMTLLYVWRRVNDSVENA